jgi:hypothetical protein
VTEGVVNNQGVDGLRGVVDVAGQCDCIGEGGGIGGREVVR